jgi:hypothetical protein
VSTIAPAHPHSDAVVSALTSAGLLVGRGKQPTGSGWQGTAGASSFKPYVVLFPSSGTPDGDLADANEYLDFTFQLTCVGNTQDGAIAVADIAKAALVGVRLSVAGRSCYPVRLLADPLAQRDDAVSPPLHYLTPQFRFRSQPA